MTFNTPSGTRGVSQPGFFTRFLKLFNKYSAGRIRKTGKFGELPSLVLTTVGSKSGLERKTPLAYFPADGGGWLIVASYAGAAKNPAWYYNLAAHPDQVSIEFGGRTESVVAEQLHGSERDAAWRQIVAASQRFADYQDKTDRPLPVIRLRPASE
ncbi:MAG TPA: nitroreductase family deazaflavin-dependent oxidoreductase [Nitrospira sp.]|nr:nitroreductase family deazaflavin-dependent oxidoreductase [Mycobacterium sp.]HNN43931.1 nitroreductase family deazaflavin-dependent oxidoreductase [Nitrospira sp.]